MNIHGHSNYISPYIEPNMQRRTEQLLTKRIQKKKEKNSPRKRGGFQKLCGIRTRNRVNKDHDSARSSSGQGTAITKITTLGPEPRKPRADTNVDSEPAKPRHYRNELNRRRRSLSQTTMSPNQQCRKKRGVWADQFLPDVWYDYAIYYICSICVRCAAWTRCP